MRASIEFRKISDKDLPELAQVLKLVFPEDGHVIARYVQDIFPRLRNYSFIAVHENRIVGFSIGVLEDMWTGHVLYLGVLPEYRRRKIGTRLLCLTLHEMFSMKTVEKVFLEVSVHNEIAINFYRKIGFEIERRIPKYYLDGTDCYVMSLTRDVYEHYTYSYCSKFLCRDEVEQAQEASSQQSRQQACLSSG